MATRKRARLPTKRPTKNASRILGRGFPGRAATASALSASSFPSAQWVYLANPVPQIVANRAAALLKTPGLTIGMAWIEVVTTVDCKTTATLISSQTLRYTCENHGHGITGISVYGLI